MTNENRKYIQHKELYLAYRGELNRKEVQQGGDCGGFVLLYSRNEPNTVKQPYSNKNQFKKWIKYGWAEAIYWGGAAESPSGEREATQ